MIVLLSPSKSMTIPTHHASTQIPIFDGEAKLLSSILSKKSEQELADWMKLSDKLAQETKHIFSNFVKNPLKKHRAISSYTGDVYGGINANDFTPFEWKHAEKHVRIISGLYGYLKPHDAILPYRLEMATKAIHPKIKNLYSFWTEKVTNALQSDIEHSNDNTLINLSSDEYFKVIGSLHAKIIHIHFREIKGGSPKFVSTYAKKARGLMARYIIKNKINKAEQIKRFDFENYSFSADFSSEFNWYFIR
jgi:hypothetical protein